MSYRPYAVIVQEAITQSSGSVNITMTNNSGSTIQALRPVRSNVSGELNLIDPSFESQARSIVGVTSAAIADGASGNVSTSGKIEGALALGFSLGDEIFLAKNGSLTNITPSAGVNGFILNDICIRIGVIVKNSDNPSNQDLLVSISILGPLAA